MAVITDEAATLPPPPPATTTTGGEVATTMDYLGNPDAPSVIDIPGVDQQWQTVVYPKYGKLAVPVTVRDVRGREADFAIDTHGFQFLTHVPAFGDPAALVGDWADAQQVRARAYPEVKKLLLEHLQADEVFTFMHIHRNLVEDTRTGTESQSPAKGVHVDATGDGALGVLRLLALQNPALAPLLTSYRRTRLINTWVPLRAARRDPLGLVDARTVDYGRDVVAIRMQKQGVAFATCMLRPNEKHEWYYRSGMAPGDVLLINIADCEHDGDGEGEGRNRTGTPHASFHVPGTEAEPARESVEIRSYVFYK